MPTALVNIVNLSHGLRHWASRLLRVEEGGLASRIWRSRCALAPPRVTIRYGNGWTPSMSGRTPKRSAGSRRSPPSRSSGRCS